MKNQALMRRVLGAVLEEDALLFGAFATGVEACAVRLYRRDGGVLATHAMDGDGSGHFGATVSGAGVGTRYKFVLDGREVPDPYARSLPDGVHGAAEVVGSTYAWRHGPGDGRPLREHVLYELHVGTFTPEGTYDAAREHLRDLVDLGVTAIELMPVAAFAGERGWGYDGVALYAPFAPYGTPDQLRRLVDEAHGLGLAVFLDVVYNHFGPSGAYLTAYSPNYFTREIHTPWGDAPDFGHAVMRRAVVENALYWLREFRFDGLRLDATHAIHDGSPLHIVREIAEAVGRLEPRKILIAEDGRNDPRCVQRLGVDGIWADDFHHQLRVTLTGEKDGYYAAYTRSVARLARTIQRGWWYEGQLYGPSQRPRGAPAEALPASAFVYCTQNHDQIGNRALGTRLDRDVSLEAFAVASTILLFLPMTPMLFMGQEWAASTPFLYFTDHELGLGKLVSEGRREEFAGFEAFSDPVRRAQIPDPQAASTFEASKLRWEERARSPHAEMFALHRALIALRRSDPVLRRAGRDALEAEAVGQVLIVRRWFEGETRTLLANLGKEAVEVSTLGGADGVPRGALLFSSRAGALTERLLGESAVILAGT